MSSKEREEKGIGSLPGNLSDPISLTEKGELIRKAPGDHLFDSFIKNKEIEWDRSLFRT